MAFKIAFICLFLSGCLITPDWTDGSDCWRYGVPTDNTGRMTRLELDEIPVTRLRYDAFAKACNLKPVKLSWSNRGNPEAVACYDIAGDAIYLLSPFAGKMDLYEERCHALLGMKHNACSGYGIGKDASACNWDKT